MVNCSRDQSIEQPRRRSWPVILPPLSLFHSQTLSTNCSRVSSVHFCCFPPIRRATTICVALPLSSLPPTTLPTLPPDLSLGAGTHLSHVSIPLSTSTSPQ